MQKLIKFIYIGFLSTVINKNIYLNDMHTTCETTNMIVRDQTIVY